VIGWQIDNEMDHGEVSVTTSTIAAKFRQYYKNKFGSVGKLNKRLFTVSYGHSYSSWDQILLQSNVTEDALQAHWF